MKEKLTVERRKRSGKNNIKKYEGRNFQSLSGCDGENYKDGTGKI